VHHDFCPSGAAAGRVKTRGAVGNYDAGRHGGGHDDDLTRSE